MGQPTVLAGRYRLISPLGRGGMGQVWEARDERLGRPVAVKLLTGEALAGRAHAGDLVRRFTREAAVTAGLAHPGVPASYDAGEYEGGLFLVMELVDGCTVGDLTAEHGPLPVAWVAGIGAQVAAVLAVAHERGIVHRDIKPQNVMVTGDGTAKILDFGIAGLPGQRITSTGVAIGTPAYMAPEQSHGLPATPRTDLYALGCLLYEMLAGEPVFSAPSPAGLMRMHLEQPPAPLRRGDVPPVLAALVLQLLEKDPARRPADALAAFGGLLPFVRQPGPLGDVDPAAGSRSGLRLYSLVQARLGTALAADARQAAAAGQAARPPVTPAAGRRRPGGTSWVVLHSLWVLPSLLFGLGTWLSFGYIAVRHWRLRWAFIGLCYLIADVWAFVMAGSGPINGPNTAEQNLGVSVLVILWAAGFIHVLWVNFTTRLALRARLSNRPPVTAPSPWRRRAG
ncbi:MAG: serine/threonine-protein kinase [Gemmatimonadota bacterium]